MELIEKEATFKKLCDELPKGQWKTVIALTVISEMPAVDAEPVRHGYWIPVETETGVAAYGVYEMTVMNYKCSECGGLIDISEKDFKYCPHCGAKMDAERK